MDNEHCQCMRHGPEIPCGARPTAEDLLCDGCRKGSCVAVAFGKLGQDPEDFMREWVHCQIDGEIKVNWQVPPPEQMKLIDRAIKRAMTWGGTTPGGSFPIPGPEGSIETRPQSPDPKEA